MSEKAKKFLPIVFLMVGMTVIIGTLTLPRESVNGECMIWALGEDWKSVEMKDVPERWNSRHRDLFELHSDDRIAEGYKKMLEAYQQSKAVE